MWIFWCLVGAAIGLAVSRTSPIGIIPGLILGAILGPFAMYLFLGATEQHRH